MNIKEVKYEWLEKLDLVAYKVANKSVDFGTNKNLGGIYWKVAYFVGNVGHFFQVLIPLSLMDLFSRWNYKEDE